jgi:hypothetical protein
MAFLARVEVARMSEYRVYTFGKDRQIAGVRAFVCGNDADATVWAKQMVGGNDVELWSGVRLVIRLNAMGKRGAVTHEVIDGRMVPKPAK